MKHESDARFYTALGAATIPAIARLVTEREPDIDKLIRERERNRCIACSHVGHKGVCGAENRVFAKGACQCGAKRDE